MTGESASSHLLAVFINPAKFCRVCLLGSTPSVSENSWLAISILVKLAGVWHVKTTGST